MTLSKETSNQIVKAEMPHYYELTLPNGTKRHCGTLKDVECMLTSIQMQSMLKFFCHIHQKR